MLVSKRKIKLLSIFVIAIMTIIIPIAMSASNGKQDASVKPFSGQIIQGSVCFRYDSFIDTWVLNFEQSGQNAYTVSGYDMIYPASMAGGGGVYRGNLLLTLDERGYDIYGSGGYADHNIVIDLSSRPLKGKDHLRWSDITGANIVNYPDGLNFTQITCPAPGAASSPADRTTAGNK